MAKAIYLAQIRNRMESIQKEYNALSEAYQILDRVGSTRGRKAKIPTLQEMLGSEVKVKTGKRGRPPGAKNKPGSKKPGPKTKTVKVAVAAEVKSAEEVKKTVVKPVAAKRGRPAKAVKPVKVEKAQAVVASASKSVKTAAKGIKAKSVAKPVSKSASKPIAKKPGTRNRIPNLAEKIQEIVGKNARFTTNSVITDKLAGLYPGKSRSDLGKYISVILANMKARKELAVVTQDAKGNKMRSGLWGLPNWFEGSKPKVEFLK
jgi:Tfp pilus assembly major pilin PilA